MKIVVLTNKNRIVENILEEFVINKIIVEAIFIEDSDTITLKTKVKGYIPDFFINIVRYLRGLDPIKKSDALKYYSKFSKSVIRSKSFNSQKMENELIKIKPDLIVLAGSRILKENIINIPKIGILNAHPGLLPKYRGVHVLMWSILNNDPIGVTVHFINKGIDTGSICTQQEIKIKEKDSIKSLRAEANVLSGKLMAQVVLKYINGEEVQLQDNPVEKGSLYFKMDKENFAKVEKKLQDYV